MSKSIIAWLPFLLFMGVLILFKYLNFANRYYNIFLLLIIAFGFSLVLIYKFVYKMKPDEKTE